MGRVLFTATLVRGHIAKFHIPYLRWFKEQGWETWVAAKNDYPDGTCEIPYCDHYVDIDFARSPFSTQTFIAFNQLKRLFADTHFDIVHTHTPVGGVLTRVAANKSRKSGTKVIYTAHGFHFYNGAPALNWMLWFPVEVLMSKFTDVLITINNEDYERAKRFARCDVEFVPGVGVDLKRFPAQVSPSEKREELGISADDYVLLSVGDLIPRKNQALILEALAILPENVKLLVCGDGAERENLLEAAERLGVSERANFLGFRDDVAEIMAASDALVFPSAHEGLPVSVLEAMACGLPVIAGNIRGINPDLIDDGVTGLVLGELGAAKIAESVRKLMDDPSLSSDIAERAAAAVVRFGLEGTLAETSEIYLRGGCSMLTRVKLGLSKSDFGVVSVGDLTKNKNHAALVEAMVELPNNVKLFVVGEGPLRENLESLAERLGVRNRVALLGFREDIPALLASCDVFAFPSFHEGLPVSVIEAMAVGLPVVASDIRGVSPDLIEDGVTGILLRRNARDCIITALEKLMDDDKLRARLARNGQEASRRFARAGIMMRYAEIYEKALAG